MNIIQLCDLIDDAVADANGALESETGDRSFALEQIVRKLTAATAEARRNPRPTSMVAISGDGGTTIQVGGHFYGR